MQKLSYRDRINIIEMDFSTNYLNQDLTTGLKLEKNYACKYTKLLNILVHTPKKMSVTSLHTNLIHFP